MTLRHSLRLIPALALCLLAVACSDPAPAPSPSPSPATPVVNDEVAVIETDFGKIKIKFYPEVAPRHVEHFKKLAREGFYNGLAFHRIAPENLIQGGDPTTRGNDRSKWGLGEPGQPTVPAEFSQRSFLRGIVGAARRGDSVNSATSQFFICLAPHPEWNGRYTVFGDVVEGLNVVELISKAPRDEANDQPRQKVVMRRVYLEKI